MANKNIQDVRLFFAGLVLDAASFTSADELSVGKAKNSIVLFRRLMAGLIHERKSWKCIHRLCLEI